MTSPFDDAAGETADQQLVTAARGGDRGAMEQLLAFHQPWILNIAVRMLWRRADAEDATQEILVKIWKRLATYRGESAFRTWLYRIAVNHILDLRKQDWVVAQPRRTLAERDRMMGDYPDLDLPDPRTVPVPLEILVEEVKLGCTTGVLVCLDGRQRLVFILGEILGASDRTGAEIVGVSAANFRQILSRTRRDLYQYLNGSCSLMNPGAACKCAKKTRGLIEKGLIDPNKLQFTAACRQRVREVVRARTRELEEAYDAYGPAIFRDHPFYECADPVAEARKALAGFSPDLLR